MKVARGETIKFNATFEGVPQPGYPKVTITDCLGNKVVEGTGSQDPGNQQLYWFEFHCPVDAWICDNWQINWDFLNTDGVAQKLEQRFEVIDLYIEETETRAQQTLAILGRPCRLFIRFFDEPEEITLSIINPDTGETLKSHQQSTLRKLIDNDGTIIYFKDEVFDSLGSYIALWEFKPTTTTGPYTFYEVIQVVPLKIVLTITELRQLIDKYQKKFGTIRAYEDAELFEYLKQGIEYVNSVFPQSYFNVFSVPQELKFCWLLASAWYALNAQYLLEADGTFDYSGLSVSLSVDRTEYIESELERLKTFLDEQLTKIKTTYARRRTAGAVGARGGGPIPQVRYVGPWRKPTLTGG